MLASHPRVRFFSEPFNPEHNNCPLQSWYHEAKPDDQPQLTHYLGYFFEMRRPSWRGWYSSLPAWRLLARSVKACSGRWLGMRPLIKDPMALFSVGWLARRYNPDIIILSRHPAAFVSSLKRLQWRFHFEHFRCQKHLMETCLAPFAAEIEQMCRRPTDVISNAILLWRALHHRIHLYQEGHPEWIYARHEDLSRQPQEEFQRLFQAVGLKFTRKVARILDEYTRRENPVEAQAGVIHDLRRDSAGNIWNWLCRLTPLEILRIRKGTEDIAYQFYSDADWHPEGARKGRNRVWHKLPRHAA
jgi:hypothetical protein